MSKPGTDIAGKVYQTIASVAAMPIEKLHPDLDLRSDLNLDSLAVYEVVIELEESYDINLGDNELDRLNVLSDLVELIARKLRR